MSNDLLSCLDRTLRFAEQTIATVTDDLREGATPCPEFTVTQLVSHLAVCTRWYARIPADGVIDFASMTEDDLTSQDLVGVFRQAADLARAAWSPQEMPRVFSAPFGNVTGEQMTGYMVMELLCHGLDVTLATGVRVSPDDDLLLLSTNVARAMGDETLRAPHMMGPRVPVPMEAPVVDQFLGLLGRDPAWTPTRL